jgi:hypothetical protein
MISSDELYNHLSVSELAEADKNYNRKEKEERENIV